VPHTSDATADLDDAECNAFIVLIPGGCTSIVQPMDRSVKKPIKDSIKVRFINTTYFSLCLLILDLLLISSKTACC